ncbi:hypothetical protein [Effusibacillus pohliae]|uniref:hypothetical protein n=1 Tax=Effusibacillus pohliae TaxID=232270 RepID=UPI00036E5323|nr:hypothetical protein [Effusibacillus pohliae]
MGYDDVHFQGEKDAAEEMDRMENEGGGVVMQNIPNAGPVQRGELVEVEGEPGKAETGGE